MGLQLTQSLVFLSSAEAGHGTLRSQVTSRGITVFLKPSQSQWPHFKNSLITTQQDDEGIGRHTVTGKQQILICAGEILPLLFFSISAELQQHLVI